MKTYYQIVAKWNENHKSLENDKQTSFEQLSEKLIIPLGHFNYLLRTAAVFLQHFARRTNSIHNIDWHLMLSAMLTVFRNPCQKLSTRFCEIFFFFKNDCENRNSNAWAMIHSQCCTGESIFISIWGTCDIIHLRVPAFWEKKIDFNPIVCFIHHFNAFVTCFENDAFIKIRRACAMTAEYRIAIRKFNTIRSQNGINYSEATMSCKRYLLPNLIHVNSTITEVY